jgi:alternate signal-mediated exported protein
MKKSVRTLIGVSLAAVIGSTLLLGGAGTLAFWSDSSAAAAQEIQSGTLDLGTSASITVSNPTIKQCAPTCSAVTAYAGGALVPGDVVSATMNVPVTLAGQNMKADFVITPSKTAPAVTTANTALTNALSIKVVRVNNAAVTADAAGAATVSLTPASVTTATVPVTLEITFPWGTVGQYNDTMGGQVRLAAAYTLTQVAG